MIWILIYAIVGPLPWIGLFAMLLLGRSRMTRLERSHYDLPENPPRVTILIPAKDEAVNIRACIDSVIALQYLNFNIIAIDDRSGDQTGAILDDIALTHPRTVRAIHIKDLPPDWLGKCNALHVATRQCESDWLLFVDSDVQLHPNALSDALSTCIQRKYDALSISTRLECHTFLERLMLPICAGAWAIAFKVSLTNDDQRTDIAAANGQFFLIRREAYETVGGHETVRDQIVEDVELMRTLKNRGFRTRLFFGKHLASTRMHTNFNRMLHGWGRIFSGTARMKPARIIATIAFLIFCGLSVYPALAWSIYQLAYQHDWKWLSFAAIHFIAMTQILSMIYRGSGNRARYALLFPIGVAIFVFILAYAVRLCFTRKYLWRGTTYTPKRAHHFSG